MIPFALRFYTGEAVPYEDDEEYDEDDEDDEDDDEDEDEDDEDSDSQTKGVPKPKVKSAAEVKDLFKATGDAKEGDKVNNEECKQQ